MSNKTAKKRLMASNNEEFLTSDEERSQRERKARKECMALRRGKPLIFDIKKWKKWEEIHVARLYILYVDYESGIHGLNKIWNDDARGPDKIFCMTEDFGVGFRRTRSSIYHHWTKGEPIQTWKEVLAATKMEMEQAGFVSRPSQWWLMNRSPGSV